MSKTRVAVFTPLPPSKSGIADYAAELAPFLARHVELVHVIADQAEAPSGPAAGLEVVRLSDYLRQSAQDHETLRLYHLGNNPYHEFVFREIAKRPGVTVLHDFLLHHLVATLTLGRLDLTGYERYMAYDHGRLGKELARQRQVGVFSEYEQFLMPLNGTVLDSSLGIITHSHDSASKVRSLRPTLPVCRIPHFLGPTPPGFVQDSREAARKRLGLRSDRIIIASPGFITPPKQIELTLRALRATKDRLPPFEYWLVGERNPSYDIDARIRESGLQEHVRITGYVDLVRFHDFIQASDIIVNLRYPTAGETSGTLIRAMGLDRPVVIFDYGPFADFPPAVASVLPVNTQETGPLEAALLRLATDAEYREALGRKAGEFVRRENAIERCAAAYADFIHQCLQPEGLQRGARLPRRSAITKYAPPSAKEAEKTTGECLNSIQDPAAREYFQTHAKRFQFTLMKVPVVKEPMAVLELGSYTSMLSALKHNHGFQRVVGSDFNPDHPPGRLSDLGSPDGRDTFEFYNFNVEVHRFPFDSRSFDLVLCCEIIEHLAMDPMFLLSEINRVLKFGGMLLLTTPNIAGARALKALLYGYAPHLYSAYYRSRSTNRHNIEYSAHELRALVEAAGFGEISLETHDCWTEPDPAIMRVLRHGGYPTHLRGDNLFVRAVKETEVVDRYPKEIYDPGPRVLIHVCPYD